MDARHFISLVLAEEMTRLGKKEITLEQFNYLVDALDRQSFTPEHADFFPAIRELAEKVSDPNKRS